MMPTAANAVIVSTRTPNEAKEGGVSRGSHV